MDSTKIYYAYDEDGKNIWVGRAVDILDAVKTASSETGMAREKLSVESA